jgi:hypothetical protein
MTITQHVQSGGDPEPGEEKDNDMLNLKYGAGASYGRLAMDGLEE